MELTHKATGSEVSSLRACYGASIADFLTSSADTIFAQLATRNDFDLISTQRDAWIEQIEFLRSALNGLAGTLFLEFNIPRMGRRIDAVLLIGPVVFVVEFKIGETEFERAAVEQVWDYALDLKNFHEASHHASLVPILIATNSKESGVITLQVDADNVYRPIQVNLEGFRKAVDATLQQISGTALNGVPLACDSETGRRDAGAPRGQSSVRRHRSRFLSAPSQFFLQMRRVPLALNALKIKL